MAGVFKPITEDDIRRAVAAWDQAGGTVRKGRDIAKMSHTRFARALDMAGIDRYAKNKPARGSKLAIRQMRPVSTETLAYVAGLFDATGKLMEDKGKERFVISFRHGTMADRVKQMTGVGTVTYISTGSRYTVTREEELLPLLTAILPFVTAQRNRVTAAIRDLEEAQQQTLIHRQVDEIAAEVAVKIAEEN